MGRNVACEQAHLFGEFVRDNLGGESRDLHRLDFHRQDTRANNTLSESARRLEGILS